MLETETLADVDVFCADGQRRAETSLLIRVSDRFREALRQNPGRLELPVESVASFDVFWRQLKNYADEHGLAWGPSSRKVRRYPDYYFPVQERLSLIRFCMANGAASMIYGVFWTALSIEEMNYLLWKLYDPTVNIFSRRVTGRVLRRLVERLLRANVQQARYLTPQTYTLLWEAMLTETPDLLTAKPSRQLKYLQLLGSSGHQPLPALWLPENYTCWPAVREGIRRLGIQPREREVLMLPPLPVPADWQFFDVELICTDGRCRGERSLLSRASVLWAEKLTQSRRLEFQEPIATLQMFLRYLQMYVDRYSLWGPSRALISRNGPGKYFQPTDRLPLARFCHRQQAFKMLLPLFWQPISVAEAAEFLAMLESEEAEEELDSFMESGKHYSMPYTLRMRLVKFILLTATAETATQLTLKDYQLLWNHLHGELQDLADKNPRWETLLLDLLPLSGFHFRDLVRGLDHHLVPEEESAHPAVQGRIRLLLA